MDGSMNKVLIIESCEKKIVQEDFSNTSIVHVRNSKILEKELGYKLVTHMSQIPDALTQRWDHIVCAYASPYMKYKAYMEILEKNPKAKMWFLVADHDLEDSILLRNYVKDTHNQYNVICNNPRSGYRHWILGKNLEGKKLNDWINEWHTVNLNTLIYEDRNQEVIPEFKSGCLYFGTFRKHRAKDMAEFNGINDYTISSSTKNQKKYEEAKIEAKFIDKLEWTDKQETLNAFKYSIYFEDLHTHTNYAYLANRFYECLMCNVIMFFDAKCQNTIDEARKSGYSIHDSFIVRDAAQLNDKMAKINASPAAYEWALNWQNKNKEIALRDKKDTIEQIKKILK